MHRELIRLSESRPYCGAANDVRVYSSIVKSHTFRRAPQGRRFLWRKRYIPPTSYYDTSAANPDESFAGWNEGAQMTENVNVQYVGFEAKALVREYSFIVRGALNETSEFTLTIGNEAFGSRRVRIQDGPEVCSLRLHRELAVFGNHPPKTHFCISETDLDEYRSSHTSKAWAYLYKPKVPRDL